ncbi:MAG: hypothetical protein OHK0023_23680 [Anaerolineae bacterium]
MRLREYAADDKVACLNMFDGNVGHFFAPHEREQYEQFLEHPDCIYFVLENSEGELVGAGGYYVYTFDQNIVGLCWGLVRRDLHGYGYGRYLLRERLRRICTNGFRGEVRLDTSQHTKGFFEREGFVVYELETDGYAPGLDRYHMRRTLDDLVCREYSEVAPNRA